MLQKSFFGLVFEKSLGKSKFLLPATGYCYCWQRKCYHRLGYMKPATKLVSYNSTVVAFIQFATNQTRRFPFAYCTYNISLNICVYVHVHLYIHASFWTPQSRHFSRNWKALRTLPKATASTVRLPSPFVFLREAKPNEGNFHDL